MRSPSWMLLSLALISGCMSPSPKRFAKDLKRENCRIPEKLAVNASVDGYAIDLEIQNDTGEVWRLDYNSSSVSQVPSGWQSKLVDGQTTVYNKDAVKPPLVVAPGFLKSQVYPGDLFAAGYAGAAFAPWPLPDGGGFRLTLGFRGADDKLSFCLLTGNLSTLVQKVK